MGGCRKSPAHGEKCSKNGGFLRLIRRHVVLPRVRTPPFDSSRIDYPPVERESDNLPRDELAACLQRLFRGQLKTSAARNLHADDCHGLDGVLADQATVAPDGAPTAFFMRVRVK